jgi:CubicO group peptidase (beta-lactamase class C family)
MKPVRIAGVRAAAALAALLLLATFLAAAQLPTAKPSEVGLSVERLDRLSRSMQEYVDKGRLPGLVVLAARNGKVVYRKAFGKLDPAAGRPCPRTRSLGSPPKPRP